MGIRLHAHAGALVAAMCCRYSLALHNTQVEPSIGQVWVKYPYDGGNMAYGTCCDRNASCGGVFAENTGGWGHKESDLRWNAKREVQRLSGIHIPICQNHLITPPTRLPPVPPLPPPPPPPPPVPNMLTCWDGTKCPERSEKPGVQCCSAPVMAGLSCAQIFVCEKKRTCTGKKACYQAFTSMWDKNNNGWQLAGIVSFILVMLLFLCIFCIYCVCDRCLFNKRKYQAMRERKKFLKQLPQISSMEAS